MKRKGLFLLLTAFGLLCAGANLWSMPKEGLFTAAVTFPLAPLGRLLRGLSLAGAWQNALAICLYVLIGLSPLFIFLIAIKRRARTSADALLPLLSLAIFFVLYLMINPFDIGRLFGDDAATEIGGALLCGCVHAIFGAYLVLRLLARFRDGTLAQLEGYARVLLYLADLFFVYAVLGACFGEYLGNLFALRAGNIGNEASLAPSYVFLTLRFLVDALPYALDLRIVDAALRLLSETRASRHGAGSVRAAEALARRCKTALGAVVLSNVAFNLLQLPFLRALRVVKTTVPLPVFSLFFALCALLVSRYAAENKALKDESDSII